MTRRFFALAVLGGVLVMGLPGSAMAQRGRRNTAPITPFGPMYDLNTMKQAGGNPMAYEQLMEQKMMLQQQQMMMRQQQAMMQQAQRAQAQAKKKTADGTTPGVNTPNAPGFNVPGNSANVFLGPMPRRKTRKRPAPTFKSSTAKATTAPATTDTPTTPAADPAKPAAARPKLSETRGVSPKS